MIGGHPALRLLARLKLRGVLRKQRRRLRTPAGALLALIGLFAILGWFAAILVPPLLARRPGFHVEQGVRLPFGAGIFVFTVLTISNALGHRGLFIPSSEIELLLAAPVSRSQLVRYRLVSLLGRSLFSAIVFSLLAMFRAPVPWFGLLGTFVTVMSLPILGQGVSLAAGDIENRFASKLAGFPYRWINLAGLALLLALGLSMANDSSRHPARAGFDLPTLNQVLEQPVARALLLPFKPWSSMISATSASGFWGWFAFCVALAVLGFELVSRTSVDFRELSLATSADVARRLNRVRRGTGGASSTEAPKESAGWRVPWIFGRGPLGAIAWRKCASIVRKARSGVTIGLGIIGVVMLISTRAAPSQPWSALGATAMIAGLGTLYLCGALRFDFREDLDAMTVIKAWPIAPWRIFVATLLPEVALVSALIIGAIAARIAITGDVPQALVPCLLAVPLLVSAWVAIDNAAFLFAPVRLAPGQDSMLQNAGRALLLLMLRFFLLFAVAAMVGVAVWFAMLAQEPLQLSNEAVATLAALPGLLVLFAEVALLIFVGGRMLRRFDVARDRG